VNAVGTDGEGNASTPLWWAAYCGKAGGRGFHSFTSELNLSNSKTH
jgi:hypothetical protein